MKTAWRRTAAVLEVFGVFLAGPLVAELLVRLLRLELVNPLERFTVAISDAELITASYQIFVLLLVQFAGWFLLIIPLDWLRGRRVPGTYGLTSAGQSWMALSLAGLATVSLAAWPVLGLHLIDAVYNLGETTPWRQAIFDTSWRRWEFWLFTAVSSWAFVAVVEELFFRGYCQRRLAEDWGDGPAILGIACLFTFTHGQYLMADAYNIGMLASLLIVAIGFGVVFAWTRSLVPSIIAHAIINVPMSPLWQAVVMTAMVIATIVLGRRAAMVIKQVFSVAPLVTCTALMAIGTAWAIGAQRVQYLGPAAVGMVVLAIVVYVVDHVVRLTSRCS